MILLSSPGANFCPSYYGEGGAYEKGTPVRFTSNTWWSSLCDSNLPRNLTTAQGNEIGCGHSPATCEASPRIRSRGYVAIPSACAWYLLPHRRSLPHSGRKETSRAERESFVRTHPRLCSDQKSHTEVSRVE